MNRPMSVLLVLAALLSSASVTAQGTLDRIRERGEIRIGYRGDARPLSFEENGAPAGYSVDLCKRVAAGIGEQLKMPAMKATYVKVTTDNRFDALVKGDIDIECGATTITLGRLERVDFTLMTFVTGGTFLSKAENRVGGPADLAGKRIAVPRGTSTATALQAYLKENSIDARVVTVDDRGAGMSRLTRGDVDALAGDQIVLLGDALDVLETNKDANFSFADALFSYEPYGFMVRRNDADFRLAVNRELAKVFRDGDQAQIYQNWVGSNGVKPSPMLIAMYLVQGLSE
ncbi:MAG TPA: amino acid ABC transporter substrate-binding protein [Gammaproteobacteria bacterium]|nr:amino acid ABC transporter substrate-binding protein [Gammaproteobacteria bacterium]